MKKQFRFLATAALMAAALTFNACTTGDDFSAQTLHSEAVSGTRAATVSEVIDFFHVPSFQMASDQYGYNLYTGYVSEEDQYTSGYLHRIGDTDTYVQFPVNYIMQEWPPYLWQYDYWNGGFAMSDFTNTDQGDYMNQCSVYNGGWAGIDNDNFAVAFGYADFFNDSLTMFNKCAKIYLTDETGYRIENLGDEGPVRGTVKRGKFNSVKVCNTTYGHKVMEEGNYFSHPLQEIDGWFKVIFIGFSSDDTSLTPTGYKEYYLANYDFTLIEEAGGLYGIRDGWNEVDLSDLGTGVHMVVINFEGSDSGDYGLNTPAYVALDNLSVSL